MALTEDGSRPATNGLTQADVEAARARDPGAVTRLYEAYAPALLRFFMASVSDRHAAEDLTGTVFTAAIEALPRFRGPVEAIGGWLFRIARHDLLDYRRHQARARLTPLDDNLDEAAMALDAPDPQEVALLRVESSKALAALERLSPDQRDVLVLRLAGGLTAPEVAAVLGKTTGAVKALQHRGLASLARLLGIDRPAGGVDRAYPNEPPRRLSNLEEE